MEVNIENTNKTMNMLQDKNSIESMHQRFKNAIGEMDFKSKKEFSEHFGFDSANYLSRFKGKPLPKRILNIIQAHERTKQIILNKLKD